LNVVITHPEELYGCNKGSSEKDENAIAGGETIANTDFQYSAFKEEDGKIFCKVI
jgi:predicted phosphohydrolase